MVWRRHGAIRSQGSTESSHRAQQAVWLGPSTRYGVGERRFGALSRRQSTARMNRRPPGRAAASIDWGGALPSGSVELLELEALDDRRCRVEQSVESGRAR